MSDLPIPMSVGGSSSSPASNVSPSGTGGQVSPQQVSSSDDLVGSLAKEQGIQGRNESVTYQEQPIDVEVGPELAKAGVIKRSEKVDLPPDIVQMGVTAVGPAQPLSTVTTIQLPLTDEQIIVGLHAQIVSSIRWLAEWCVRRLKQVHVHLKTLGGKVVRERE